MTDTLEVVRNFKRSIKKDTSLYIVVFIFNFGLHCKLYFSAITLHMRDALKSQYLFMVAVMPFPANQNVKYESVSIVLSKYSINFLW